MATIDTWEFYDRASDIGPEGWAGLGEQAARDIFDMVIDRVIVYPKEQPQNRWAPPHKIKILWR